jgi:hypothetical protein
MPATAAAPKRMRVRDRLAAVIWDTQCRVTDSAFLRAFGPWNKFHSDAEHWLTILTQLHEEMIGARK